MVIAWGHSVKKCNWGGRQGRGSENLSAGYKGAMIAFSDSECLHGKIGAFPKASVRENG